MDKIVFRVCVKNKKELTEFNKVHIYIKAVKNNQAEYFNTNIYILPQEWDNKHHIVINNPNADYLNRMIQEYIIRLETIELKYWKSDKPIDVFELKRVVENNTNINNIDSIKQITTDYIINTAKRKESTKNNILTTVDILSKYKKDISIYDIDASFLYEFENFLFASNYKINTVAKHLRNIRTIYNEAIRRNVITENKYPFKNFHIKTSQTNYSFLLEEELKLLETIQLDGKHKVLMHTLDAFLFCCYTGLRYSDFRIVREKNIISIDGIKWLIFNSVKTNHSTKVPLNLLFDGKALNILNKYHNADQFFTDIKSNSQVDKELIKISKLVCLNKHISFHTARHTNATLLLYKGVSLTTIQKLLAHKSIKTTQLYAEVLPETIINDLKNHL